MVLFNLSMLIWGMFSIALPTLALNSWSTHVPWGYSHHPTIMNEIAGYVAMDL